MPDKPPQPQTAATPPVVVCAAVIIREKSVLITLRPQGKKLGGFWEFPGGKVDPGETPEQALVREIKEELDIEISVGDRIETVHHDYDWGSVRILAYLCRWNSGTIRHLEVADHCWVTPQQFSEFNILPADQPILERLTSILSCNN